MDELDVFVAVAEEQGFSAAAKQLDSTPAAVSRRIKALEQRLGVRLLQRTTRKVQLTEAGELYFREVSRLLGDLRCVEGRLDELTGQPTGELRIVTPMSFGQRRLAAAVVRFATRYPQLRVTLQLEDQETDIIGGGFDLALRIARWAIRPWWPDPSPRCRESSAPHPTICDDAVPRRHRTNCCSTTAFATT